MKTIVTYELLNIITQSQHVRNKWQSKIISSLSAAFLVVVTLIDILLCPFLPLIWLYTSNYVVLSSTYNHNTDTTSPPILRLPEPRIFSLINSKNFLSGTLFLFSIRELKLLFPLGLLYILSIFIIDG